MLTTVSAAVSSPDATDKLVWLDCDPGIDDAMAILLLANYPGIRIVGVSAVTGNTHLNQTAINAARMLQIAGVTGIPVVKGAAHPLIRKPEYAEHVHGHDGLAGISALAKEENDELAAVLEALELSADAVLPDSEKAVVVMANTILAQPKPVTIIALGALTNVALLLSLFPEVKRNVERIVWMGGAVMGGNVNNASEFNVFHDPEAAQIVCDAAIRKDVADSILTDVMMVPLDATNAGVVHDALMDRIKQELLPINPAFAGFVDHICRFLFETCVKLSEGDNYGSNEAADAHRSKGIPIHDPVAIAVFLKPEIATFKKLNVRVICGEHPAEGLTLVDFANRTGAEKNVTVAMTASSSMFWEMMIDALKQCAARTPLK
ncbi:nucleoside hydrolase [Ramicandelaber brevisporus]|nr:nucleoside hydrolase [Ramicandelaber brevisporus]